MHDPLLERYVRHLQEQEVVTVKHYRLVARNFLRWMASRRLTFEGLAAPVVHRYLVCRRSLGHDPRNHFYPLRTFLRWLVHEGKLLHDPTQGVLCSWVGIPGGFPAYQGPLRKVFDLPRGIVTYRRLMFWPDLERYVAGRMALGYSRRHLQAVLNASRDLHHYLVRRGVAVLMDITPDHVDAFGRYRQRQGVCAKVARDSKACVEHFLQFAFKRRGRFFRPLVVKPDYPALPRRRIERYIDFCRNHKGQTAATARDHRQELSRLARYLDDCSRKRIQDVTLSDLEEYLLKRAKRHHISMTAVGILRSFWRYLHLHGVLKRDLSLHIQSPCRFRADRRPKYLPWSKVQQLLDSIPRNSVTDKRDYAILTLLACHGLRAREAAKLCLTDIDWQDHSFLLRERKAGDTLRLPLASRAQEALQDYLAVRPTSASPEIFLTVHAPIQPLGRALYQVALRQIRRHLGGAVLRPGATVLRHSFAKALLDRGATIPDIGALLGHRSLHGTNAYLRIATEDLRDVGDTYANALAGGISDA